MSKCFYKEKSPSNVEWVCLEIDTTGLKVFGIEITLEESPDNAHLKCAHVFGGLPRECVKKVYDVQRSDKDGEFLFVKGLTDACGCPSKNSTANNDQAKSESCEL